MRITKAIIEKRMESIEKRYLTVVGTAIDTEVGYAQCSKHSNVRPNPWTCSPSENAHRLYGEWSSLSDLLEVANA